MKRVPVVDVGKAAIGTAARSVFQQNTQSNHRVNRPQRQPLIGPFLAAAADNRGQIANVLAAILSLAERPICN
jgi:hypothetical protein